MKIQHLGLCLVLALASSLPHAAFAQSYSPVQSSYRELGWSLWDSVKGQVQTANSDTDSQDFMNNQPSFMQIVNANLSEGMKYAAASKNPLDVTRLYMFSSYAPRIYFLMDGGASTSGVGVTIGPAAALNGKSPAGSNYLVFPNCNSAYSNSYKTQPNGRTQSIPMMTGDFVQLPTVQAGQELALVFFGHLDDNGNPSQTFYIDPAANPDGMQHAVAFFPTDSRYIIVAFENTFGEGTYGYGDADFNDTIAVIDIGQANADYLEKHSQDLAEIIGCHCFPARFCGRDLHRNRPARKTTVMNVHRLRNCRTYRRGRRKSRGAAAVELALCLPFLVTLSLGCMETCNLIYVRTRMNSAVFEAARMATRPTTATQASATSTGVVNYANSLLTQLGVQGAQVSVQVIDHNTLQSKSLSAAVPLDLVTVSATAPWNQNSITNFVLPASMSLTAQVWLIVE